MSDRPSVGAHLARLDRLTPRRRLLWAFVAGGGAAFGHAPWSLWPLTIFGLALVFALSRPLVRSREVAKVWWAAGTGYFGVALSWIIEPFLVDIEVHGWMAPFALVFMAGGLALFWGLAGGAVRRISRGHGAGLAVATGLALVLAGWARGLVFTGFPWALPGHVLIASPALQLAQLGGAMLLSLVVVGLALSLFFALARPWPGLVIWGAAAALPFALGAALMPPPGETQGRPIVRLVQPNIPQAEKWDPVKAPQHFDRLLALSAEPGEPDLVVWPETAVPAWLEEVPPVLSEAAGQRPLVFGINRVEGQRIYNALVLLSPGGEVAEVYDKHHLVPFGEYIPLGDLLGRFGLRGLAQRDGGGFSPGPGARLIDLPGIGPTLPLICYEGIFPGDIAASPARPEVLLLITNDAWFGTVSGPYQHLAQARLRSVEQGLPMVRVANTGVSAVIDPAGRLSGEMPLGTAGIRDVPLPPPLGPTLYSRSGDWPWALLMMLGLVVLALRSRKNPTDKGVDAPGGGV